VERSKGDFEECFEWAVENRKKILSWDDVWVGNEDLKSKFLRLFSLSNNKDAKLGSFGEWLNGYWKRDLFWRKGLFDWEKIQELQLLQVVHDSCLVFGKEDC